MRPYLVFYMGAGQHIGARIGSVPSTPANLAEAHREMYLVHLQTDITGTQHFSVLGLRRKQRRIGRRS